MFKENKQKTPHTQWEGREKHQLLHTTFTPQGQVVSTASIKTTPSLKATKPPKSSEHPETKGTIKSYMTLQITLVDLLLKLQIPL